MFRLTKNCLSSELVEILLNQFLDNFQQKNLLQYQRCDCGVDLVLPMYVKVYVIMDSQLWRKFTILWVFSESNFSKESMKDDNQIRGLEPQSKMGFFLVYVIDTGNGVCLPIHVVVFGVLEFFICHTFLKKSIKAFLLKTFSLSGWKVPSQSSFLSSNDCSWYTFSWEINFTRFFEVAKRPSKLPAFSSNW